MARKHKPPHKPSRKPPHKKKKSDKGQIGGDHDSDNPTTGNGPGDHDRGQDHDGTGPSDSAVVASPGASGVAYETGAGTLFGQGQAVGYGDPSVYSSDPGDPVRHYHQQPVYIHEIAATTTPATTDTGATANTNATPSEVMAP
jgi:hypothetical protein